MRCQACNTNKHDHLTNYGGASICDYCLDKYNPKTRVVHLLSEKTIDNIKSLIATKEKEIRDLEIRLRQNETVKESGYNQLTFKSY